jgi:two-component sensor histidine kinase
VSATRTPPLWGQVLTWAAGSTLAGAATGLAVGVFREGGFDSRVLAVSVVFANVVGFSVFLSAVVLYPRLRRLPPAARFALLEVALLSGSFAGTFLAITLFPLFALADPTRVLALASVNSVLALVVGNVAWSYEGMRWRLAESLREVEEVRLVEARLQEQAARAELSALQARINPHFFFNTLNTISSLVGADPEKAEEVVLTAADATAVTLAEELEFVERYLSIERARFGERLRVAWTIDPPARAALVPGLILQPLVENAVGHGIAPVAGGGTVRIAASVADGRLRVEVADDGAGLRADPATLVSHDHALGNVRRRLETRYGGQARFDLVAGPGGKGACARVEFPFAAAGRSEP